MEASETKAEKRYVEREWVCLGERVTEKLKMGVAFAAFTGTGESLVVQTGFVFEKGRARKTKEERRADAFDEALRPIARAMAATDQAGRRLIKVAVLERLDHLWVQS